MIVKTEERVEHGVPVTREWHIFGHYFNYPLCIDSWCTPFGVINIKVSNEDGRPTQPTPKPEPHCAPVARKDKESAT